MSKFLFSWTRFLRISKISGSFFFTKNKKIQQSGKLAIEIIRFDDDRRKYKNIKKFLRLGRVFSWFINFGFFFRYQEKKFEGLGNFQLQ